MLHLPGTLDSVSSKKLEKQIKVELLMNGRLVVSLRDILSARRMFGRPGHGRNNLAKITDPASRDAEIRFPKVKRGKLCPVW